jgi:hypothetical protein
MLLVSSEGKATSLIVVSLWEQMRRFSEDAVYFFCKEERIILDGTGLDDNQLVQWLMLW